MSPFPIGSIFKVAKNLRHLVLDSKRQEHDLKSAYNYTTSDLRHIVERCSVLETLGLPVDIQDHSNGSTRYKRVNMQRFTSTGKLKALHLRNRCEPRRRAKADARAIARPFLRHPISSSLVVIVDLGAWVQGFYVTRKDILPLSGGFLSTVPLLHDQLA
ncbi:uncharacterized protein B0I36DRAFT_356276 [Microdochium trichocladiopsis]|uniref:Uncharacterized protein n=1 Tax=Microdochium trichocladiopsis TaxID=1682393 RepID=A0A9P9BK74_9PEZI|nr:uncharacterized protein B0I36DRAFT_356832 [Microdochium trichocladiopsis]XP_046004571.1 uncharacterized protein B0I36DRAFT_356276 [Microdochium trichocladiopsis]KAH7009111.1 hypothetical protein B0I36DRAFT_356832 [Microdochium trichocladiopsis]KAH7012195.1 hypothetical protein B0I36DRAFT_356276 [Microdochium trichocladiopsis]